MKKVITILLGFVILSYSLITIKNNTIADGVRRQLLTSFASKSYEVTDSVSICGKLYGCGNGMQYTGAVLVKTNKNIEEIKKQLQPEVAADCEIMILKDCPECIQAAFDSSKYDDYSDEYIVVSLTLDKELGNLPDTVMQSVLELDMRGH